MQDIWDVRCDEENHNLSTNYFLFFIKIKKKLNINLIAFKVIHICIQQKLLRKSY